MVQGVSLPRVLPLSPDLERAVHAHRLGSAAVASTLLALASRHAPTAAGDLAVTVEFAVLLGAIVTLVWVVARYGLTSHLAHPVRFVQVWAGATVGALTGLWLVLAGDEGTRVLVLGATGMLLVAASRSWHVQQALRPL